MKILILTDVFWSEYAGGIGKSLLPEIEGLANQENQVRVVSRKLQSDKPYYELMEGYELYRYFAPDKKSVFHRLHPFFTFIHLPKLISSLHLQQPFDIAYVHNIFQADVISRVLPNIPLVYVYHASGYNEINIDAERGKYGKLKFIVKLFSRWVMSIEKKVLTNANRVIVRSKFMKNDMHHLYQDINDAKVISLPLCVDTEKFYYVENSSDARQKLGLADDRPILLTIRRLVARMGIENLISAMQNVVQKFPNVLLLIGGTGYLEADLREMIRQYGLEQNVTLVGFIPEEQLPTYYQAANLFVLPTLSYEGFGLVTIESLACGTPVIATPVGASPEVLGALGEEFLFADSNSSAIAEGIMHWLAQGFSTNKRRICMKYCVNNYSDKKISKHLECIFLNLLKHVNI
jgi:glycosyltransferase involved in cell wall biosynthesis